MNSVLILALVATSIQMGSAQQGMGMMKCRGMDMKMYEQDQMWAKDCMKEANSQIAMMMPAMRQRYYNACFSKCMVMKRGLVDDKGMGMKEKAAEFVMMTAPDAVHGELVPKAQKCVDMYAVTIRNGGMTCESYMPLMQCMGEMYMQTCMSMPMSMSMSM